VKLVFRKNEASEISVFRKVSDAEQAFSYIDMIKDLIETRKMEEPEVLGAFTDAEKGSIKSMTTLINKSIATTGTE
jgi:hypothetical protein